MRPLGKAEIPGLEQMRLDKEIRRLKEHPKFTQCLIESQRFECKRIIKIGIMLNLGITILNLSIFILTLNTNFRKETVSKQGKTNGEVRNPMSMQKTKVEKTLAHIPEVVCKVGMDRVCPPGTPASKPSLFCPTWGVSALTKGAIVSKFLGYLYSRKGLEVIFCDYTLFSEYLSNGSFHFDFFERNPGQPGIYILGGPILGISFYQEGITWKRVLPSLLILDARDLRSRRGDGAIGWIPRRVLRHNLMMTNPYQGILVSLKQADEALRKGRNTWVRTDEIR
jgi:hypothetical protein